MEQRIRVLIADDRPYARKGLRALLGGWPAVEVTCEARDGDEVLQQVAQGQADVVLMDVRMPRMNGLEATRRIKDDWPGVRVVLLSLDIGFRTEALAAGADAFLIKGCPSQELHCALTSCGA